MLIFTSSDFTGSWIAPRDLVLVTAIASVLPDPNGGAGTVAHIIGFTPDLVAGPTDFQLRTIFVENEKVSIRHHFENLNMPIVKGTEFYWTSVGMLVCTQLFFEEGSAQVLS